MADPPPNNPPEPAGDPDAEMTAGAPASFAARHPWAVFILPYVVYALISMFEPKPDTSFDLLGWTIGYDAYPIVYTL